MITPNLILVQDRVATDGTRLGPQQNDQHFSLKRANFVFFESDPLLGGNLHCWKKACFRFQFQCAAVETDLPPTAEGSVIINFELLLSFHSLLLRVELGPRGMKLEEDNTHNPIRCCLSQRFTPPGNWSNVCKVIPVDGVGIFYCQVKNVSKHWNKCLRVLWNLYL